MATTKAAAKATQDDLDVPGIVLHEEPKVYLAAIAGPWLLRHSTPSWRADDPEKGFQRIVKELRAKEIARTVLDTRRTFPNAITLATKAKAFEVTGCNLHLPRNSKFLVVDGQHRLWAQKYSKVEGTPADTPEHVIQDLLNEIHLGSVRGWAPYEKALQMRGLIEGGLIEDEVAERYRMTAREVRQQLAAVELMDQLYFPITADPTDPEHKTKFSYFLEFQKNGRIQAHMGQMGDLPQRFARWVRDERVDTGARVRRLPRILDSAEATHLLEVIGFEAADEYLAKQHPEEHELYAVMERARNRLQAMTVSELVALGESEERQKILQTLQAEIERITQAALRVRRAS